MKKLLILFCFFSVITACNKEPQHPIKYVDVKIQSTHPLADSYYIIDSKGLKSSVIINYYERINDPISYAVVGEFFGRQGDNFSLVVDTANSIGNTYIIQGNSLKAVENPSDPAQLLVKFQIY